MPGGLNTHSRILHILGLATADDEKLRHTSKEMEKEIQKTQAVDGKLQHTSKEMVPVSGAVAVAEESQCPRLGQDTLRLEEEEKEKGEEEKGGEEKESGGRAGG